MPTGWKTIWTSSIGPTASRRCSATGSAAARGPKSIFSSARRGRRRQAEPAGVRRLAQRSRRARVSANSRANDVLRVYHHAARHAVRRHLHGHRARASAGRPADDAEQAAAVDKHIASKPRAKSDLDRTELAKEKTGVFTGCVCRQSRQRPADSDLDGRLCAGQLRHRRDHGRAGPRHARLRVCPSSSICRSCPWSSTRRDEPSRDESALRAHGAGRQETPSFGLGRPIHSAGLTTAVRPPKFKKQHHRRSGKKPDSARGAVNYKLARLAVQPAALLGRAVPDPARAGCGWQADRAVAERSAEAACP